MARLTRVDLFSPEEVAIVHVMNRVVRRCYLMGIDPVSRKNYDHRKRWLEDRMRFLASVFGIDLLAFAILSDHFHQILRSRPDVVETWDDTEVARRWLTLCPPARRSRKSSRALTEHELDSIRNCPERLAEIRLRLSDISWWMRLLCQPLAVSANREDEMDGKFWQSRFRAVRLDDEAAVLTASGYVDLNVLRAALAKTLETSDFTSVQRRIQALLRAMVDEQQQEEKLPESDGTGRPQSRPDDFLAPLFLDERQESPGPQPHLQGRRCSDKGFLALRPQEYIELLDWTARQIAPGKRGVTPTDTPPVLNRLGLKPTVWTELVSQFGQFFASVAGTPETLNGLRSRVTQRPFRQRRRYRDLMPIGSDAAGG